MTMETPIPTLHPRPPPRRANESSVRRSVSWPPWSRKVDDPGPRGWPLEWPLGSPRKMLERLCKVQFISIYHCFRIGHCTDLFGGLLFSCRFCIELTPLTQLKNMEVERCGTTIPTYPWAVALDVVGLDYIQ